MFGKKSIEGLVDAGVELYLALQLQDKHRVCICLDLCLYFFV